MGDLTTEILFIDLDRMAAEEWRVAGAAAGGACVSFRGQPVELRAMSTDDLSVGCHVPVFRCLTLAPLHRACRSVLTIYSIVRIYATMKIDSDVMEAAADRASELLKALSNRHRLLIICQLIDGERSVGELAEFLNLRDSTVSQHLALLRKDGLVAARRDAQSIYYSIASDPAREILKTLYQVFCAPSKVANKAAKPRLK